MKRRTSRKDAAFRKKQAVVQCVRKHLPFKIEQDLTSSLQLRYPQVISVLIVDTENSRECNMLHVCVEVTSREDIPSNVDETIWKFLADKHQCGGRICFFSKGMLDGYMPEDSVACFTFREDMSYMFLNHTICLLKLNLLMIMMMVLYVKHASQLEKGSTHWTMSHLICWSGCLMCPSKCNCFFNIL